jgi:hypothetical protein
LHAQWLDSCPFLCTGDGNSPSVAIKTEAGSADVQRESASQGPRPAAGQADWSSALSGSRYEVVLLAMLEGLRGALPASDRTIAR